LRSETSFSSMSTAHVADHYNAHSALLPEERVKSKSYNVFQFNNLIKSILIAETASFLRTTQTFEIEHYGDYCCGKGGDLKKVAALKTVKSYTGIDFANQSLEDAKARTKNDRHPFDARFACVDVSTESFHISPTDDRFDLISCQFAMHYSFRNEATIQQFFSNVAQNLRYHGAFIATYPRESSLLKQKQISPSFGHPGLWKVEFFEEHAYRFSLTDAVEDVPEYVVPHKKLIEVAAQHNLKAALVLRFDTFYARYAHKHPDICKRIPVSWNALRCEEQELCALYNVAIFIRGAGAPLYPPP
jgi:mRNA (guanine-N7-)-methyltransferase